MALRKRMVWAATLMLCMALVAGFIVGHFVAPPAEAATLWQLEMRWLHATYGDAVGVLKSDIGGTSGSTPVDVTYYVSNNGLTWFGPYDPGPATHQDSSCDLNYATKSTWEINTSYPYVKWHVVVQGGYDNGKWERNCNTLTSLQAEKWIQPLFPGLWRDAIAAWR